MTLHVNMPETGYYAIVIPGYKPVYVKLHQKVNVEDYPEVYKDWLTHHNLSSGSFLNNPVGPDTWSNMFANIKAKHPIQNYDASLKSIIMSLNDEAEWSREQIADWLETLDDKQNPVITKPTKEIENDNPF